jgi:hypothetical protein
MRSIVFTLKYYPQKYKVEILPGWPGNKQGVILSVRNSLISLWVTCFNLFILLLLHSGSISAQYTGLTLKSATTSWPGITLVVTKGDQVRTTAIGFNVAMTTGLDRSYDVGLLPVDNFKIYSRLVCGDAGVDLAVQCLPEKYDSLKVPIGIDLPSGGDVSFRAEGIILPIGIVPVLEDRLLKINTPLKENTVSYKVTLPQNIHGTGRFYLGFSTVTDLEKVVKPDIIYNARYTNRKIVVTSNIIQDAKVSLYDLNGRKISEHRLLKENRNEIELPVVTNSVYLLLIRGDKHDQLIKVPVVYE